MPILRVLEVLSFSAFGVSSLVADAMPTADGSGLEKIVAGGGVLALCAFMLLQNYRQQAATNKVLREKDAQIIAQTASYQGLLKEKIETDNRLAAALEARPCLYKDRVFKKHGP